MLQTQNGNEEKSRKIYWLN